jgi:small subunit ribosomal protein S1
MEFKMTNVKVGKIVKGKVFQVTDDLCYVDIQAFADGVIYKEGFSLNKTITSCKEVVEEGQELEFKITKIDHENQRILLSRKDMLKSEKRQQFDEETKDNKRITARVTKITRGGLLLRHDGIELFMPTSQIDVEHINPDDFKGKDLECVVIENSDRRVVVSRKKVLIEDMKKAKKEAFDAIEVGAILDGTITKIMPYGAFVSLGEVEGLLHVSEISHHRIDNPNQELKENETIKVKVLKKEKGKIALSVKAMLPTPWDEFTSNHNNGDEVEGTIVRKMKNAMLVEVAKDVVGIINQNDYSWNPNENLAGTVEVGSKLTLKIISMDPKKKRMSLSKKHLEYNPWADVSVKKGEIISGVVTELQSRGAIVQVQNVNAFLPISEISEDRINQVSDALKLEQVINAIVLDVDKQNWRMKLSIKQLKEKQEREMFAKYKENEDEVQAQTLGDLFKDEFDKLKK